MSKAKGNYEQLYKQLIRVVKKVGFSALLSL